MEIYNKILKHLAENDNGEFVEITHLSDNLNFLKNKVDELSKAGQIKVKSPGVYFIDDRTYGNKENLRKIYAKILLPGHEYLKEIKSQQKNDFKMPKKKKIEAIQALIYELRTQNVYDRTKVENFITKAKEVISYIDGIDSVFVKEVTAVSTKNLTNKILIEDWDDLLLSALERLMSKIELTEKDDELDLIYVSLKRIEELNNLESEKFDLIKLVQLCKELNDAYRLDNFYTVVVLVRTIINHVPPIFSQNNFASVASQYKSDGNAKSFKESMEHLENSSRKIADSYVHSTIRKQESLPTSVQVDFKQGLDVLLSEVVRILK